MDGGEKPLVKVGTREVTCWLLSRIVLYASDGTSERCPIGRGADTLDEERWEKMAQNRKGGES